MATNNNKPLQRKRKMGDVDVFRDSPFFKIRSLVSLLRPRFLQILRTPDFQKCKAATEIEEGMKLVMVYYRQMLTEGNKRGKIEKLPRQFASAEQNQGRQKVNHQAEQVTKGTVDKKLSPPISSETVDKKLSPPPIRLETVDQKLSPPPISSDKKLSPPHISSERTLESGGRLYGSYILGSSLAGWNFITFRNRIPPQYYGVTKETHRSNRRKVEIDSTQET
ncbi:hypothetical protein POM88_009391 [Heracleum sosnowskyi]|uniref:Uncharacterized protein n=1 Tax=Heracleum sosnowskyi TaxID=360622 RepID=A0AAD8N9G5_9APIA|nr:hypothetical protein POM88_009391 [Heracleum sosnowskyi]